MDEAQVVELLERQGVLFPSHYEAAGEHRLLDARAEPRAWACERFAGGTAYSHYRTR